MVTIEQIIKWFKKRGNHILLEDDTSSLNINAPRNIFDAEENHISLITKT